MTIQDYETLREYYYGSFQYDLENLKLPQLPKNQMYPAGGIASMRGDREQEFLRTLSPDRRASCVLCTFFSVMVDQAMHSYGGDALDTFSTLAGYPKFGILGGWNSSPWHIIFESIEDDCVPESEIRKLATVAMELFVREVKEFFATHLPAQSAEEFLQLMGRDPEAFGHPRDRKNSIDAILVTAYHNNL